MAELKEDKLIIKEKETAMSQAKDEAKSITNLEGLIKPKAVPVPKVTVDNEKTSG